MSYILEALKKAQAERQLGTSPTIHAPTLQSADQAEGGGRFKKPVVLALAGMSVAIAVLLAMVLRPAAQPGTASASASGPASAAVPASAAAPGALAVAPAQVAAAPASPPAEVASLPAPVADLPPSVANLARANAPEHQPAPAPAAATTAAAAAPATAVAAKPAAAPEESVVNQRDLPEPIRRSVPEVAVGGYIYSKNPADRLLLVDKVLRHEGEEVAPGLILEKLQPKEAIFSFKGYRYRVPY